MQLSAQDAKEQGLTVTRGIVISVRAIRRTVRHPPISITVVGADCLHRKDTKEDLKVIIDDQSAWVLNLLVLWQQSYKKG